jgi:tetratricopeptide (TPR) repeat protein
VVNAAITAINSHIVVRIAGDCADLSPDLFIVYLGKTLVEAGRREEGRNYLLQVAEARPRHFQPLYNILGELAAKEEDYERAIMWLKTACRFNPDNTAAFLTLSEVHLRRGDVAEAEEATRQGIQRIPDDHALLYRVGKMYLRYGQTDIARSYFARALCLDPKNPTYLEETENTSIRPVVEWP